MTIFNISNFLSEQSYKVLIIQLNPESTCFKASFSSKINIPKCKIKYKRKINKKFLIRKKYKLKYLNKKTINKFIIKIDKNIDIIFYSKIINYYFNSNKKHIKYYCKKALFYKKSRKKL